MLEFSQYSLLRHLWNKAYLRIDIVRNPLYKGSISSMNSRYFQMEMGSYYIGFDSSNIFTDDTSYMIHAAWNPEPS